MHTLTLSQAIDSWSAYLPEETYRQWEKIAVAHRWSARHREMFDCDRSQSVFWLVEGTAKVGRYLPNRREDYQYLASGGEWLGELTLVESDYPSFFVMATQPCNVLEIPRSAVKQAMMQFPTFNLSVLSQLGQRLREMQARREAMIRQSSRSRILSFFCEYCRRFGKLRGDQIWVEYPLNHTDISKFTATSRQSVHTLMADLRRQALLDYDQQRIRLSQTQLHALRQQAQQG